MGCDQSSGGGRSLSDLDGRVRAARLRGEDPGQLLPGVHRVASVAKRWLVGTHQGSVDEAHLQAYLDEFVFRFNRRHSLSRGLVFHRVLQLAVGHEPVRYRDFVIDPQAKAHPPAGRAGHGHPRSLELAHRHGGARHPARQLTSWPQRPSGLRGRPPPKPDASHRCIIGCGRRALDKS